MKKTMILACIAGAMFAAVSLTSCGGDDDQYVGSTEQTANNNNGNGSNGGDNNNGSNGGDNNNGSNGGDNNNGSNGGDNNNGSNGGDNQNQGEGIQAVDLGLPSGLKWASCNVGATKPEEAGGYFRWNCTGTIDPVNFTIPNYLEPGDKVYRIDKSYALTGKKILDAADDAAAVNLGGAWRMPTKADYMELISYTTNVITTRNGVKGHLITSKANENSIFMPLTGCVSIQDNNEYGLMKTGSWGCYWASSLSETSSENAVAFILISEEIGGYSWGIDDKDRRYFYNVRAVCN